MNISAPRDQDLILWEKWYKSRSQYDLELLMKQMMPVIRNYTQQYARRVSPVALDSEAKKLALGAFETFDPARGILLSTHLVARLQKLSRHAYERQSTVSIPEHQRIDFNRINRAKADLEDEFGRRPTMPELADHLALPIPHIEKILGNVGRKEFMESGEGPTFQQANDDDLIHLAYNDMTPLQKQIFEMRTGYNGTTIPDTRKIRKGAEIVRELGVTQGQLSYQVQMITQILQRASRLR